MSTIHGVKLSLFILTRTDYSYDCLLRPIHKLKEAEGKFTDLYISLVCFLNCKLMICIGDFYIGAVCFIDPMV